MRKWIAICLIAAGSFALPHATPAQDSAQQPNTKAPGHYYHLKFVIQEVDAAGKPTNSRVYTSTVSTAQEDSSSIRVGSRVPIATGSFSTGPNNTQTNTQFQYIDLGVKLDARNPREVDGKLSLYLQAEITSQGDAVEISNVHEPIIRQNRWQSIVLIPIAKPTVVFTSDSLDSKGSLQMVVTATPVQ